MEPILEHNEKKCRFDLVLNGRSVGYITYEICDGALDIQHTVVNPDYRGKDFGRKLLDAAVQYAEKTDMKIIPTCSYAEKMLTKRD